MAAAELFRELKSDAEEWARGRSALWRVPILLYMTYAGYHHLRDPMYQSIFGGIIFGIHELGHVIFSSLGHFLMSAGGSFWQVAAPCVAVFVFMRQRDFFGISVAGSWLSFSLYGMATYMGDARAQQLPLLGLSDQPEHDWHYLLSTLGLLNYDMSIAFLTRCLAFLILVGSLFLGNWICLRMLQHSRTV